MKDCCDREKGVIICPNCSNRIEDLKTLRCPRCFASLLKMGCDGNCRKCGAKSKI